MRSWGVGGGGALYRSAPPQGTVRTRPQTRTSLGPSYPCPPHLLENMVPRTFQPQYVLVGGPAYTGGSCLVSGGPGLGTPVELAGRRGRAAMLTLSYLIARCAGILQRAVGQHHQVWAGPGPGGVCGPTAAASQGPEGGLEGPGQGVVAGTSPFPLPPMFCPLWARTGTGPRGHQQGVPSHPWKLRTQRPGERRVLGSRSTEGET